MTNEEKDKLNRKLFDGLPPFTLVITKPHDAQLICEALMLKLAHGDKEASFSAMRSLNAAVRTMGPEEGVRQFFDEGIKRNYDFPTFIKPLFIHVYSHIASKLKKLK